MKAELVMTNILGRYCLEEVLGRGAMGVVYRAFDQVTRRTVALKVLSPDACGEEAMDRFRVEMQWLARCRSPHVAAIHQAGRIEGVDYIAMELMADTLAARIARGSSTTDELVSVGAQVLMGLGAAHACGVVHRDVKPANIGIGADGLIKLLDFGAAAALAWNSPSGYQRTHLSRLVVGSLPYMSPEQLRADPPDPRADVYGAGAVLYELATGMRPFDGREGAAAIDAVLHHPPQRPSGLNPDIDPQLERVILRALAKYPARRFTSAFAMMDALVGSRPPEPNRAPVSLGPAAARTAVSQPAA